MRNNFQILHHRPLHKKHLHRYLDNRGGMSLAQLMRRSPQGTGHCGTLCRPCNSGNGMKQARTLSNRPLHFKSLF